MNRTFIMMTVLLVLLAPVLLPAADNPRIVNYTANMLDNGLSVNVHWLSRNPVKTVKVIAGGQLKEARIDEYDNLSNPDGFSGEITLVVPFQRGVGQASVPFSIQIEDDLRLKSEFSSGVVVLPVSSQPGMQAPQHDDWGRQHVNPAHDGGQSGGQQGGKGDIVDKLLAVADRFDTPPSLDSITVSKIGTESVSFSGKANDDKGLREIIFRVYDNQGNKVNEQTLANLGKIWQGSTQPVKLPGGAYRVVAQAFDSKGNTSTEKSASFTMSGPSAPIQPVTTAPVQQPVSAAPSETVAAPAPAAVVNTTEQAPAMLPNDTSQQSMPVTQMPQTAPVTPAMPTDPGMMQPAMMQSPAMSQGGMPQQGMMPPTAMPNSGMPPQPVMNTPVMPSDQATMQPSMSQPPAMPPNGMPGSSGAMNPPMPTDPAMMQPATAPPSGMPAMPVDPNPVPVPATPPVPPASDMSTPVTPAVPQPTVPPVAVTGSGALRVIILPSEILREGARWKLQGVTEWSDKENEGALAAGKYTLEFKPVDGYKTPASRPVEIRDRDTVEMLVTYIKL